MITLKYNGNWAFIQRFYSVRDEAAARKAGVLTAVLFLVFPAFYLLPAIAARVALPDLPDREMAYVAMSLRVLPEGVMGLMLASMFAATMSALDSDYNVMSSVMTRDVYQRLIRPAAGNRELMWVARLVTVAVGGIVLVGALFIGGFGGAFEANRLFTGLFGIPMVVPLVFGVLWRGPRPAGALATVVVGIGVGLYLHAHSEVSWPVATLIEIAVSVATLWMSGLIESRDEAYRERVATFFTRLATPIPDTDKPLEAPEFRRALALLLAFVLAAASMLYATMGARSLAEPGGLLALVAAGTCAILAGAFYLCGRVPQTSGRPNRSRD